MADDTGKHATLYDILGVPTDASSQQIKQAYRKLAMKYHPDRVAAEDKMEANKKFSNISAAYEVLSDAGARRRYDLGISGGSDDNNVGDTYTDSNSFADPIFVRVYVRKNQFRDPIDLFEHMFRHEFQTKNHNHDVDPSHYYAFEDNRGLHQNRNQTSGSSGNNFYSTRTTTEILNGKIKIRTEKLYSDGRREIIVNGRSLQDGDADIENANSDEFLQNDGSSMCPICVLFCCAFFVNCCGILFSCFAHLARSCMHRK